MAFSPMCETSLFPDEVAQTNTLPWAVARYTSRQPEKSTGLLSPFCVGVHVSYMPINVSLYVSLCGCQRMVRKY